MHSKNKRSSAQGNCKCDIPGVFALVVIRQDRTGRTPSLRSHILCTFITIRPIVPGQYQWPPDPICQYPKGVGTGQDRWDTWPEILYTPIYMHIRIPKGPIIPGQHKLPTKRGGVGTGQDKQGGTPSWRWHIYTKKYLAHTTKCSSLKGHRTNINKSKIFVHCAWPFFFAFCCCKVATTEVTWAVPT